MQVAWRHKVPSQRLKRPIGLDTVPQHRGAYPIGGIVSTTKGDWHHMVKSRRQFPIRDVAGIHFPVGMEGKLFWQQPR